MKQYATATLILAALASPAWSQSSATGTVRGRVVAADTETPVRKARVALTPEGAPPAEPIYTAAVDWMTPSPAFGEWQDPEILEALARRASRVTLGDGQRGQLALKLVPR